MRRVENLQSQNLLIMAMLQMSIFHAQSDILADSDEEEDDSGCQSVCHPPGIALKRNDDGLNCSRSSIMKYIWIVDTHANY